MNRTALDKAIERAQKEYGKLVIKLRAIERRIKDLVAKRFGK